jgi:hypothetical protein
MSGCIVDIGEQLFRRDVEAVYKLGPRVMAELLAELGMRGFRRTEIDAVVRRYAALDRAKLAAAEMATAMSIVIILPQTNDGRALLRETLRSIKSADTRLFVAIEFDWDQSAIEMEQLGLNPERRREAR